MTVCNIRRRCSATLCRHLSRCCLQAAPGTFLLCSDTSYGPTSGSRAARPARIRTLTDGCFISSSPEHFLCPVSALYFIAGMRMSQMLSRGQVREDQCLGGPVSQLSVHSLLASLHLIDKHTGSLYTTPPQTLLLSTAAPVVRQLERNLFSAITSHTNQLNPSRKKKKE